MVGTALHFLIGKHTLHHELELAGTWVKVSLLCPGFVRTSLMDAGRNRPPSLRSEGRPASEAARVFRASLEQGVASGLSPDEVAGRVLEAVRDERFHVFPHPELLDHVRQRAELIAVQKNPVLDLPEVMRARLRPG